MYFADTESSIELTIYKNLLDQYLEKKKDDDVRKMFEDVILTTHRLVAGEISASEVDHKIYSLVITLSDADLNGNVEYFKNIDPLHIEVAQFQSLQGILSSLADN